MDLKNRRLFDAALARGDRPTERRHGHTCPQCNHRWWHDPDACKGEGATYESCTDAHVCSQCGTVQREIDLSICDKNPQHTPKVCELQDPSLGAIPVFGSNPDAPLHADSETAQWAALEAAHGRGGWSRIGSEEVVRGDQRLERVQCMLANGRQAVTYFSSKKESEMDPVLGGVPSDFDPYTKIEIPVAGYRVKVTGDVLRKGGVPVPMSFDDSVAAAVSLGAIPPTRALSAAALAFAKAAKTAIVMPVVPSPDGAHAIGTPVGDKQSAAFAAAYPPAMPSDSTVLRYGGHKDMILDPSAQPNPKTGKSELRESGPGSMVLCGGLKTDGSTWQSGSKSDHDSHWKDYSQPQQFFFRDAIGPNGDAVDLLDVVAKGGPLGGPLPAWLVTKLRGQGSPAGMWA